MWVIAHIIVCGYLALCEFVDPSKNDIQAIISDGIDLMIKEMA